MGTMNPDPRRIGDLCFNSYWRTFSVILNVEVRGNCTWITELNLSEPNENVINGTPNVKPHLTAFGDRDVIIARDVFRQDFSWESYEIFVDAMKELAYAWGFNTHGWC